MLGLGTIVLFGAALQKKAQKICTGIQVEIAGAAQKQAIPCYLIGGFVRDKILGRPTKDMDVVCVGDGIQLAEEVAQNFHPVPEVHFFKNFGTAQIKVEDLEIEFVGARKESYDFKSRKPAVENGTIELSLIHI